MPSISRIKRVGPPIGQAARRASPPERSPASDENLVAMEWRLARRKRPNLLIRMENPEGRLLARLDGRRLDREGLAFHGEESRKEPLFRMRPRRLLDRWGLTFDVLVPDKEDPTGERALGAVRRHRSGRFNEVRLEILNEFDVTATKILETGWTPLVRGLWFLGKPPWMRGRAEIIDKDGRLAGELMFDRVPGRRRLRLVTDGELASAVQRPLLVAAGAAFLVAATGP